MMAQDWPRKSDAKLAGRYLAEVNNTISPLH